MILGPKTPDSVPQRVCDTCARDLKKTQEENTQKMIGMALCNRVHSFFSSHRTLSPSAALMLAAVAAPANKQPIGAVASPPGATDHSGKLPAHIQSKVAGQITPKQQVPQVPMRYVNSTLVVLVL
jgi:hypothetical protein